MAEKPKIPRALMISLPFQGHITPFVNLALNLASKGIAITFVHLESVHRRLSEANSGEIDFFSGARESGLDIRYTTIGDGFPSEFDRDLHIQEYWVSLFYDFPDRVDEFVRKTIESDPDSLYFLVADTVYGWPAAIADKYKLVNVSFWTQPAMVFSVGYHRDLMLEKGHIPSKGTEVVEIDYIPGVKSITTRDLMAAYKQLDHKMTKIFFRAMDEVKKADFILHNTVHELESDTLSALNKHQPNYAIGPLNFSKINSTIVTKSIRPESDCAQWLATKPPGSVLYVSFGSISRTSKEAMEEIAYGLLLSEVSFIWVVRECMTVCGQGDILPSGFEDEAKDRGLIVPWCDQVAVLLDPGVGGFLTHCGWNSVVESMWGGVPMICYPLSYDQPTNRKLVVEDWKVGISLCDGESVDRGEVAERIRSFMSGGISERLRKEGKCVKERLENALRVDGSSERNLNKFVKELERKLWEKAIV